MKEYPLVSIITVCFNSEKHIRQTIESVLNQSYANLEYIIIDGGSTDSTLDIINEYYPKFHDRMKWISEKDNGIYDAMNKGLNMSKGEIIGIINSDDWYESDAVQNVVKEYEADPEIEFFYGNLYWINEAKELVNLSVPMKDLSQYTFQYWMPFAHPTAFVCKNVYKRIDTFDTKYRITADYEFVLRCMHNKVKFKYIDKIIANFREGGVSNNEFKTFKESTKVKIRYGYNPIKAWCRYYEVAFKIYFLKKLEKYFWFQRLYEIYKKRK